MNDVIDSIGRWGSRSGLSVLDQGFASGANFLAAVLLARWLSPAEYGAYAVAFSVFLLLFAAYNAAVLEPASVIGPDSFPGRQTEYVLSLICVHIGLTVFFSVLVFVAALLMCSSGSPLVPVLFCLGLSIPFMPALWLVRRVCYLETKPRYALRGSVAYAILLTIGLLSLRLLDWVSAGGALLMMAVANACVSLGYLRAWNKLGGFRNYQRLCPVLRAVIREHWRYGKWLLAGAVFTWIISSIYSPLLGVFSRMEDAGGFRAMENLFLPASQALTALAFLFVPWVSRQTSLRGSPYMVRATGRITVGLGAFAAVYVIAVVGCGRWLIPIIYGKDYYNAGVSLLPYLAVPVVIRAVCDVGLGTVIRVSRRPDILFLGALCAGTFTATVGTWLVYRMGMHGAAVARMTSALVFGAIVVVPAIRLLREQRTKERSV